MKIVKEYLASHPEYDPIPTEHRIKKSIRKYKKSKAAPRKAEEPPKPKLKEEVSEELEPESESKLDDYHAAPEDVTHKTFQRIDTKILEELSPELRDNSFGGKFRSGQEGDLYGIEGYERLRDKGGKGFRKEKSKFKNRAFQGGQAGHISYGVNSTKLS